VVAGRVQVHGVTSKGGSCEGSTECGFDLRHRHRPVYRWGSRAHSRREPCGFPAADSGSRSHRRGMCGHIPVLAQKLTVTAPQRQPTCLPVSPCATRGDDATAVSQDHSGLGPCDCWAKVRRCSTVAGDAWHGRRRRRKPGFTGCVVEFAHGAGRQVAALSPAGCDRPSSRASRIFVRRSALAGSTTMRTRGDHNRSRPEHHAS